jgi:hypothetical protein
VDVSLRAAEEAQREAREARRESMRRSSDGNHQQVVINQSDARRFGAYVPFPRHGLHLVLTLLTCGFWGIIWIIDYGCWNPRKEW